MQADKTGSMISLLTALVLVMSYRTADGLCGGRDCLDEVATCVDDTCMCDFSVFGFGYGDFACYRNGHVASEIKNDPAVTSYDNETAPFPLPCRYLTTHIQTNLMIKENRKRVKIGTCEFKILPWHAKVKGKYFADGFDLAIKIQFDDEEVEDIKATVRKTGWASDGNYTFDDWGADDGYYPDGEPLGPDPVDIDRDNVRIKCEQGTDHRSILDITMCGIKATFRPFDKMLGKNQIFVPGISMDVNCAYKPKFLSQDKTMSLAPTRFGGVALKDLPGAPLDVEKKFFLRGITEGADVVQSQPNANDQCELSVDIMKECNQANRIKAVDKCYWLMSSPRLGRCYDKSTNGEDILGLFNDCLSYICAGNCSGFSSELQSKLPSNCAELEGIDMLTSWLTNKAC